MTTAYTPPPLPPDEADNSEDVESTVETSAEADYAASEGEEPAGDSEPPAPGSAQLSSNEADKAASMGDDVTDK
ncbi:MAG: hypothetical protein H0T17_08310 [Propionibacteriales bacterium]|nr:hypothetical protein [Propionibacteriales bacterium]